MGTPHKHAEIIHAYADGETVETRGYRGNWYELKMPSFSENMEYRIKPSSPKVVPFTVEDAPNLIGKAVKSKSDRFYYIIHSIEENDIYMGRFGEYTFETLLNTFTFIDGSPCGKTVEG